MYSVDKASCRVPKITPRNNNGGIIIRFQYQGQQYSISPGGKYGDKLSMANADKIASQVKTDIIAGYFDFTLEKYQPKVKQPDNVIPINKHIEPNLKDIWEQYKLSKQANAAKTTQKEKWEQVDRCLKKVPLELLKIDNAHLLIPELLKTYSGNTLDRIINDFQACANLAFETNLISSNPWKKLKQQLPVKPSSDRTKKAYSRDEVNLIVQAFRLDWYCSTKAAFKDSWYADFIEFLFLTGCRPEDAIALTWNCIQDKVIVFDKAYCCGILKSTKNNKSRIFPITPKIKELLDRRESYVLNQPDKLLFPSQNGSYINLRNFTQRYTKRIVEILVKEGKVKQYLPTYNLRNTSITHYLRQGVDIATVAALMETSEEMINKHYWSPDFDIINNNVQLPQI